MSLCSLFCPSLVNQVETLTQKVAQLEAQLATLRNSRVMALDPYLTVQTAHPAKVVFSGINVQIVNGLGQTDSINGLGNLIIGYDKARPNGSAQHKVCSVGGTARYNYGDITYFESDCTAAGGTLATNHKSGSHYVVVGDEHNYSQYGGVVFGFRNNANGPWATVTGGSQNHAGGRSASVSGGHEHLVDGRDASASGGCCSYVHGSGASVTGGSQNKVTGSHASVAGGRNNHAAGQYSHISGGGWSNPTGGNVTQAAAELSVILGGDHQQSTAGSQTIPPIP